MRRRAASLSLVRRRVTDPVVHFEWIIGFEGASLCTFLSRPQWHPGSRCITKRVERGIEHYQVAPPADEDRPSRGYAPSPPPSPWACGDVGGIWQWIACGMRPVARSEDVTQHPATTLAVAMASRNHATCKKETTCDVSTARRRRGDPGSPRRRPGALTAVGLQRAPLQWWPAFLLVASQAPTPL